MSVLTMPRRTDDEEALRIIHSATVYLDWQFHIYLSRNEAKANLDARACLFNAANRILQSHGMGITRDEIEAARD